MARERRELPENWRDEWRKAGPRYDRRESWRDVVREALRFAWWWEWRAALGIVVFLALFIAVAFVAGGGS